MSDADKSTLRAILLIGTISCLFGLGYAMNEGYATGRIVGHGMIGFAVGAVVALLVRPEA